MTPEEAARVPAVIPLKFWTAYEDIPGKPGEAREVDWVQLVKRGSNGQSRDEKIARLRKSEPDIWAVVEKPYEYWKKGQEEPLEGTPLSTWPGVNSSMADRLRLLHLRTVEDLSNMTEGDIERVGMGARAMRDKARAYLENKTDTKFAEALATKDQQIAELTAQIGELTKTVEALAADKPKRDKPGDVAKGSRAA